MNRGTPDPCPTQSLCLIPLWFPSLRPRVSMGSLTARIPFQPLHMRALGKGLLSRSFLICKKDIMRLKVFCEALGALSTYY